MNETLLMVASAGALLVVGGVVFVAVLRRRRAQLNTDHFAQRWKELQKLLRNKAQWSEAVVEADGLLDEALKRKRVRGRNMGARLVHAQRQFSDNDGVWYGHKLRAKIDADPTTKLREKEVKQALIGIRQALKDVGALPQ